MAIKGIAANIPIKGVDFVEYYYTSETDELNNTTHTVTVVFNKHVYGGKFSDTTEANAFNKAKELVKGCLIKSGCFNPNTRIDNIKFKKYGFPVIPLVGVTPNPVNWTNIIGIVDGSTNTQTITGIGAPITLEITWNPLGAFNASDQTTLIIGVSGQETTLTTSGQTVVVNNNALVTFYAYAFGIVDASATVTVKNVTDSNTILDSFIVSIVSEMAPP